MFYDSAGTRAVGDDFATQMTGIKRMVVTSAEIPFIWKGTMQTDSTVAIKYGDNSATGTFTVPAGNYNATTFVPAFTSLTGSASTILADLSWSFNSDNSKWEVTNANATKSVVFDYTNGGSNTSSQTKHLKRAFGSLDWYSTTNDTQTWAANTMTVSTTPALLSGCSHLKILPSSDLIPYIDMQKAKTNKSGPSDFFLHFPVNVNPGGTVTYNPNPPVRIPFVDYVGRLPRFTFRLIKEDTQDDITEDTLWNLTFTLEA